MANWLAGIEAAFTLQSLLMMTIGVLLGMIVGAIPGFSATMGIAILMPFTFVLDPLPGMMLMLGMWGAAMYSGAIPSILLRIPGTPGAAATLIDGYPMSQKGKAGQALVISLVCSVVGGVIGVILLGAFAPVLANYALSFGSPEYFMLGLFALTMIISLSEGAMRRGLISGLIGLAIGLVGVDPLQAQERFTFGTQSLQSGINFIPVLIGLFGAAEAFAQYQRITKIDAADLSSVGKFSMSKKAWKRLVPTTLGTSVLGFAIGVAPGAGGTVASFVSYNETRRFSKDKSQFGKGEPKGVAAAESANNSSITGALVPMLTLGIPGDSATAILIGALTVHGLNPGPQLFEGSPDLVYGIFVGLLVIYIIVLLIGLLGVRAWAQVSRVPAQFLWPVVLLLCVIGSFALRNNVFDVLLMAGAGVLGYLMMKGGYPVIPLIVGLILGPIVETGLRRSLILNDGSLIWLLDPIPFVLLILTVGSLLLPLAMALFRKSRKSKVTDQENMFTS